MGKYQFNKGIMTSNASAPPKLEIVTNQDDLMEFTNAYLNEFKQGANIPQNTIDFLDKTDNAILEKLDNLFQMYEVPIGLLAKLNQLQHYNILFIIDDSGSMGTKTTTLPKDCMSLYMKKLYRDNKEYNLTRWDEVEDRVHLMLQFLVEIPSGSITLTFMNRTNTFVVDKTNATSVHEQVHNLFLVGPRGTTPTMACMKKALERQEPTMIYLMTDGIPSDCSIPELEKLLTTRKNPLNSPITLVSCTDNDADVAWMKALEEVAPYMSELDDYETEKQEVLTNQGTFFPYSVGLYIISLLVACVCPDDLDALDDKKPFTRFTMNEILGRPLRNEEYQMYWDGHPNKLNYSGFFTKFLTANTHASLCAVY
jgi:hypothetical protein